MFNVPTGLLRILNRDLVAAGIDKIDERNGRVHLHALRHSTGTHLSAAGVSSRTAQAVMRHSDIALTMNSYTDERLLETSGAVELLPELPIPTEPKQSRMVAPDGYQTSQNESIPDKIGKVIRDTKEASKPKEKTRKRASDENGRYRIRICDLCRVKATGANLEHRKSSGQTDAVEFGYTNGYTCELDLADFADTLRSFLDADQCRQLAVELLRE